MSQSLGSLRRILCRSLEELRNTIPLAGLNLLRQVGWALSNELADLSFTTIRCHGQFAALERVDNHLLVTKYNQNYTSFFVSDLLHKAGGEGSDAALNFGRLEGSLFERVSYLREDAYLREVSTFRM